MCGDNKELGALAAADAASPGHSAKPEPASGLGPDGRVSASAERRFTVGFVVSDRAASDRLWRVLHKLFSYHDETKPIRVFAMSASDMFAEQEVIDLALDSDMDGYDLRDFLAEVPCCDDLDALCDKWELPRTFAEAIEARSGETRQGLDPKDESAVSEADAPTPSGQDISDVLIEALEEFCRAAEYWAGCDEDCDPDTASPEIMRSGGAWPACAYDKARDALRQAKAGEA